MQLKEENMKLKKMLALFLCAAMLVVPLSGCNGDKEDTSPDEPSVSSAPSDDAPDNYIGTGIDYDAAFEKFAPDTVMIAAGEFEVTWAMLFFLLRSNLNSLISSGVELSDLSLPMPDGSTYAEALLTFSVDNALQYIAFEHGAMVLGVTLSEEEQEFMVESFENMMEMMGTEELLLKLLKSQYGIYDLELFKHLIYIDYLPLAIFFDLYGQNAEFLSDEKIAEFTAGEGYLMAKHILRVKTEDGDDTPRTEIEGILRQLVDYGGDDFVSFFDELMFEHSEDPGALAMFPDGYLFQSGDMEDPFFEATLALEIGALSDIVETDFGYHIILRLPLNFDIIPIRSIIMGEESTLRLITAMNMFDALLSEWRESISPVLTAEFESLDLAALFSASED